MVATTHTPPGDAAPAPPRLRRAYHDGCYGQLHLHNAIPPGGGFDELTSLVCVHGEGGTGRAFAPLLPVLGRGRSVYAPDLPGCGESDPAPAGTGFAEAGARAVADFIASMRIRSFDLLVQGAGGAVARQVALLCPDALRRTVVLDEAAVVDASALLAKLA